MSFLFDETNMMTFIRSMLIGMLILTTIGCGPSWSIKEDTGGTSRSEVLSFAQTAQDGNQKPPVIRQGDQIDITVWGYNEFNTKATVNETGTITVPLIGDLTVIGRTKDQLISELTKSLAQYVQGKPKITVTITSPSNQRITVLGSVTKQDNYPVIAETSILEIISAAGGPAPDADMHHVKIIRQGRGEDPIVVNVAKHIEEGTVHDMPLLRPGDTVFVPKKENFVRDLSDFMRDTLLVFGFFRVLY